MQILRTTGRFVAPQMSARKVVYPTLFETRCRTGQRLPGMSVERNESGVYMTRRHRVLKRTKIAADFGKREIDPRELDAFDGPALLEKTWDELKREGLVANGRGNTVRLTPKGKLELARLERR